MYVTGNHDKLGNWQADGKSLLRIDSLNWSGTIYLPEGFELEGKFTLGSWEQEAVLENCSIPSNFQVRIEKGLIIKNYIEKWKSECIQPESSITGTVNILPDVSSRYLDNSRDVIIWLPPGYEDETDLYPVLYMHDGQNLFDPKTSYLGYDWRVDEVATDLIQHHLIQKIIVVGIYNTESRTEEYSPVHLGKKYTSFIIEELKPYIDTHYRTLKDPGNTAVMGSSMGGIISFHIAWEHPDVFGMAGCLSPAFLVDNNEIVKRIKRYKGKKKPVKFYIDNGTVGLEKKFVPSMNQLIAHLNLLGYVTDEDLKVFIDEGAEHNEMAWAKRVHLPLIFFFGIE